MVELILGFSALLISAMTALAGFMVMKRNGKNHSQLNGNVDSLRTDMQMERQERIRLENELRLCHNERDRLQRREVELMRMLTEKQ